MMADKTEIEISIADSSLAALPEISAFGEVLQRRDGSPHSNRTNSPPTLSEDAPMLENASTGRLSPIRKRTARDIEHQIEQLQQENFDLKLKIYFLEQHKGVASNDTLKVNIDLKVQLQSLQNENRQKQQMWDDLCSQYELQIKTLEDQVKNSSSSAGEWEELMLMRNQFYDSEKRVKDLEGELATAAAFRDKVDSLTAELEELKLTNEDKDKLISNLSNEKTTLNNQIEELRSRVEKTAAELKQAQLQTENLRQKFSEAQTQPSQLDPPLSEEIEQLKYEITQKDAILTSRDKHISNLRTEIESYKIRLQQQDSVISDRETQISNLMQRLSQLQKQLDEIMNNNQQQDASRALAIDDMTRKLDLLKRENAALKQSRAVDDFEPTLQNKDELQALLAKHNMAIANIEAKLTELSPDDGDAVSVESTGSLLKDQLSSLVRLREQDQRVIETLKKQITAFDADGIMDMARLVKQHEDTIAELRKQRTTPRSDGVSSRGSVYKEEVDSLKQQLDLTRREAAEAKAELRRLGEDYVSRDKLESTERLVRQIAEDKRLLQNELEFYKNILSQHGLLIPYERASRSRAASEERYEDSSDGRKVSKIPRRRSRSSGSRNAEANKPANTGSAQKSRIPRRTSSPVRAASPVSVSETPSETPSSIQTDLQTEIHVLPVDSGTHELPRTSTPDNTDRPANQPDQTDDDLDREQTMNQVQKWLEEMETYGRPSELKECLDRSFEQIKQLESALQVYEEEKVIKDEYIKELEIRLDQLEAALSSLPPSYQPGKDSSRPPSSLRSVPIERASSRGPRDEHDRSDGNMMGDSGLFTYRGPAEDGSRPSSDPSDGRRSQSSLKPAHSDPHSIPDSGLDTSRSLQTHYSPGAKSDQSNGEFTQTMNRGLSSGPPAPDKMLIPARQLEFGDDDNESIYSNTMDRTTERLRAEALAAGRHSPLPLPSQDDLLNISNEDVGNRLYKPTDDNNIKYRDMATSPIKGSIHTSPVRPGAATTSERYEKRTGSPFRPQRISPPSNQLHSLQLTNQTSTHNQSTNQNYSAEHTNPNVSPPTISSPDQTTRQTDPSSTKMLSGSPFQQLLESSHQTFPTQYSSNQIAPGTIRQPISGQPLNTTQTSPPTHQNSASSYDQHLLSEPQYANKNNNSPLPHGDRTDSRPEQSSTNPHHAAKTQYYSLPTQPRTLESSTRQPSDFTNSFEKGFAQANDDYMSRNGGQAPKTTDSMDKPGDRGVLNGSGDARMSNVSGRDFTQNGPGRFNYPDSNQPFDRFSASQPLSPGAIEQYRETIKALQKENQQLTARTTQLENAVQTSEESRLQTASSARDKMSDIYKQKETDLKNLSSKYEDELSKSDLKVTDLKNQIQQYKNKLMVLMEDLKSAETKLGVCEEELGMLEKRNEFNQSELSNSRNQLNESQSQLSEARRQVTESTNQLADCKSQLAQCQDELKAARDSLNEQKIVAGQVQRELENRLDQNTAHFKSLVEQLRSQLAKSDKEASDSFKNLMTTQSGASKQVAQLTQQLQQKDSLLRQLTEKYEDDLEKTDTEINSLRQQLKQTQEALSSSRRENKENERQTQPLTEQHVPSVAENGNKRGIELFRGTPSETSRVQSPISVTNQQTTPRHYQTAKSHTPPQRDTNDYRPPINTRVHSPSRKTPVQLNQTFPPYNPRQNHDQSFHDLGGDMYPPPSTDQMNYQPAFRTSSEIDYLRSMSPQYMSAGDAGHRLSVRDDSYLGELPSTRSPIHAFSDLKTYELLKRQNKEALNCLSAVAARVQARLDTFTSSNPLDSQEWNLLRDIKKQTDSLKTCLFSCQKQITQFSFGEKGVERRKYDKLMKNYKDAMSCIRRVIETGQIDPNQLDRIESNLKGAESNLITVYHAI